MAEVYLFDSQGNQIEYLTQWDTNQTIVIDGVVTSPVPIVHFCNADSTTALNVTPSVSNGKLTVKVPNALLQQRLPILAHLYYQVESGSWKTLYTINIDLSPRVKPGSTEYVEFGENGANIATEIPDDLMLVPQYMYFLGKLDTLTFGLPATARLGDLIYISFYSTNVVPTITVTTNNEIGLKQMQTNQYCELIALWNGSVWVFAVHGVPYE